MAGPFRTNTGLTGPAWPIVAHVGPCWPTPNLSMPGCCWPTMGQHGPLWPIAGQFWPYWPIAARIGPAFTDRPVRPCMGQPGPRRPFMAQIGPLNFLLFALASLVLHTHRTTLRDMNQEQPSSILGSDALYCPARPGPAPIALLMNLLSPWFHLLRS